MQIRESETLQIYNHESYFGRLLYCRHFCPAGQKTWNWVTKKKTSKLTSQLQLRKARCLNRLCRFQKSSLAKGRREICVSILKCVVLSGDLNAFVWNEGPQPSTSFDYVQKKCSFGTHSVCFDLTFARQLAHGKKSLQVDGPLFKKIFLFDNTFWTQVTGRARVFIFRIQ